MQGCGSVSVVLPSSLLRPGTLPDQERKIHLTHLLRFLRPPLYDKRVISEKAWPWFLDELKRGNDGFNSGDETLGEKSLWFVADHEIDNLRKRGRRK